MSTRQKKFEADVKATRNLIEEQKWQIENLEIAGSSMTFNFVDGDRHQQIYVVTCDDYPENSLVYIDSDTESPTVSHKCIPVLVENIVTKTELASIQDVEMSPSIPLARSDSVESGDSNYTDCASNLDEGDEDDMEDYFNEDDEMAEDFAINPMLALDIEMISTLHENEEVISYRLLDSIDEIDIELSVPLAGFLEKEISEAWGLNPQEPLVVRLHLSLTSYLDTPKPPRVEAFQPSKKEKCGVGSQMRKILESFLAEQWPRTSNELLSAIHRFRGLSIATETEKVETTEVGSIPAPITIDDRDLAKLMEMGFSAEQSRNALILHHGDVVKASSELFTNRCETPSSVDRTTDKVTEELKSVSVPANPKFTMRQASHPPNPVLKKKKKVFGRQCSNRPTKDTNKSGSTDLTLVPSSTWLGKNAKRIPGLDHGFLAQVYQYIRQRIPTLNEYCVVCDEPHVFQNGAMLKPAVCSRELCVFAFQTLGVMSDAAEDIATGAEVVDLLLAMTRAACASGRKRVIFDPYPTIVDPNNSRELALNPKSKDYNKVQAAIDAIMPMQKMTSLGGAEMRKNLDQANILAYPLLQWIITSNRSHIVKLPSEKQISFMRTPHQFLLLSSPPAKEASFRDAKQQHGSTFAFHGSGIENWHSIIREGLVVASGTNKQVNGAAYGKGIYLSPCANVSFGYSRMGYSSNTVPGKPDSKSRFLSSDNITCIALCEVITSPDLKKSGNIWVSPKSDYVCTRFFFVKLWFLIGTDECELFHVACCDHLLPGAGGKMYEDGQVGDSNINTQDDKYKREIYQSVGYRM